MTSILEKTISIIAPHHCLVCSKENNVLCDACFVDVFDEPHEVCFLCNMPSAQSRTCQGCSRKTPIGFVWMASTYDGHAKKLIRDYKFNRRREAYRVLSDAMLRALPHLHDVIVVPVPTASSRVRMRGYDHSLLLAKEIARKRGWRLSKALVRLRGERQVGAGRATRACQAAAAYELANSRHIHGRHVLLVDDVATSGATLNATATLLAKAGAARIDAVVVAKHTLQ